MQRDEWVFEFTSGQIADAAEVKRIHHAARLAFWEAANEKVMAEIREKGISVEQSQSDQGSNVHRRYGPQIVVDATYQRKLNEATEKIAEHRSAMDEYYGWVQVLKANDNRTYPLNADDYLFFFGTK